MIIVRDLKIKVYNILGNLTQEHCKICLNPVIKHADNAKYIQKKTNLTDMTKN